MKYCVRVLLMVLLSVTLISHESSINAAVSEIKKSGTADFGLRLKFIMRTVGYIGNTVASTISGYYLAAMLPRLLQYHICPMRIDDPRARLIMCGMASFVGVSMLYNTWV